MKSTKLKHLPNILTFCNMGIGIIVIYSMVANNSMISIKLACCLIYIAAMFDFLDGCLARHLNASSEMGKQLDSLADIVTFGIAPIAIFISQLGQPSCYILLFLVIYPIAGGLRLARYNLQEFSHYSTGLPITASGFVLATVSIIYNYISSECTTKFISLYLILILTLSIMMVSRVRIRLIK